MRNHASLEVFKGMIFILLALLWFFYLPAFATDRLTDNSNGTVTDNQKGLMWAIHDNGVPVNWPDAQLFCQNYRAGGFSDWRMPTLEELTSLYNPEEKNSGGYHTRKPIETTAQSCWAANTDGGKGGRFNFTYGSIHWLRKYYSGPTRVLPVRNIE